MNNVKTVKRDESNDFTTARRKPEAYSHNMNLSLTRFDEIMLVLKNPKFRNMAHHQTILKSKDGVERHFSGIVKKTVEQEQCCN